MTTLVGIVAQNGKKGIVLASDIAGTTSNWTAQGDVAYRRQERTEGQKIYVDKEGEVAVCMSGVFDTPYTSFLSRIINKEIDLRKATKEGFLEEFLRLNLSRWGGKLPINENSNGLLLATRFDNEPKLYGIWPLGMIEQIPATITIGSGSEYASKFIQKQRLLIPGGITIPQAVDLAERSIDEASQDVYTGGLDIVVVAEDSISGFGNLIQKRMREAREGVVEDIKRGFS